MARAWGNQFWFLRKHVFCFTKKHTPRPKHFGILEKKKQKPTVVLKNPTVCFEKVNLLDLNRCASQLRAWFAAKPTAPSKPMQGLPHLLKMFARTEQIHQIHLWWSGSSLYHYQPHKVKKRLMLESSTCISPKIMYIMYLGKPTSMNQEKKSGWVRTCRTIRFWYVW